MDLLVAILGDDRRMRDMLVAGLVNLVAAECDIIVAALGEAPACKTPVEDLLLPGFAPVGEPFALRLSRLSRHLPLGLVLTAWLQAWSIRRVAATYGPNLIIYDGSLLPMIGQSPRRNLVTPDACIVLDGDTAQYQSAFPTPHVNAAPHEDCQQHIRVIVTTNRSDTQVLVEAVDFIRSLPLGRQATTSPGGRLGVSNQDLASQATVAKKVLTARYIWYILTNLHQGSAHELTFPVSALGRLLLQEGYSARVMRAIVLQDRQSYGVLDRFFLTYPLHRAIFNRRALLEHEIACAIRRRATQRSAKILSAPSGYALELLHACSQIKGSGEHQQFQIVAADIDPDGAIETDLQQAVQDVGGALLFIRGDLTTTDLHAQIRNTGPYDIVIFIGFSSWIAKKDLVGYLKLIRASLSPQGTLLVDCFKPHAFALSGKYFGYQASYYDPHEFTSILAYCGFDPEKITWISEPTGINHLCVAHID